MSVITAENRSLGHYRLLERIGSGGMGEVYRAYDKHLDRDVAIKILSPVLPSGRTPDPKGRRALQQEARTLSRLNHPNIATIYDFACEGDTDFIVMEYIAGESLATRIAREAIPPDQLLSIACQTLEGLAAAHSRGIIHRDLKPANLQITHEGRAKILDFGLAQLIRQDDVEGATATTNEDVLGITGTLAYMAPEQLRGEGVDVRTDLWGVGVVLYEMITRRLPFRGNTAAATASAILHDAPPALPDEEVAPELRAIVARCLEKDPQRRYQSAEELLSDVHRVGFGIPQASLQPDSVPKSRQSWKKMIRWSVFALLLAGLAGSAYAWWRTRHRAVPTIRSVAVLPLANLSSDPEQEYFSDGMTDAIINELSRASALKVISRTSVIRYQGTKKPVEEIARELHVDAVIEGSVYREANHVRINAQLIYAPTETQLWADTFERDMRDVLALQSEIAHAVMRQLRVRFGDGDLWAQSGSVDPEAYDALLKARFYTYRVTAVDNAKAEKFAREAIGRQPNMGDAYHILSEILWFQGMTLGFPSVGEARRLLEESLAAAERAISLGSNAHSTYALLLFTLKGDAGTAEREYKSAIVLQPNKSAVHGHYGVFLALLGRCSEARTELLRAVELDPTGEFAISIAGEFLMYCKDLQSGEQYLRTALDVDPNYERAHYLLETVYFYQHKIPEMLSLVESSTRTSQDKEEIRRVFANGGEAGYRQWFLQRVLKDPRQNQRALSLASAYAFAGDRDKAIQYLNKAYMDRDPRLEWIRAFPQYWFLWGDPEYNALLKKIGLTETRK
jgi:eukaryotic-like serine/threonine-protein kinase